MNTDADGACRFRGLNNHVSTLTKRIVLAKAVGIASGRGSRTRSEFFRVDLAPRKLQLAFQYVDCCNCLCSSGLYHSGTKQSNGTRAEDDDRVGMPQIGCLRSMNSNGQRLEQDCVWKTNGVWQLMAKVAQ
jgi:hypothetical protein